MNNDLKDTQSVVDNYFNRLNESLEDYSSSFDEKEVLEANEVEVITIDDDETTEYIDYTEQLTSVNDNLTAINTTMITINSLIVVLVVYCLYLAISNIFKLRAKSGGGK